MAKKIKKKEEFTDEGYPYIRITYDDGSILIKQKAGVSYPIPPKTEEEIRKEEYASLTTDTERIRFIATKIGLK